MIMTTLTVLSVVYVIWFTPGLIVTLGRYIKRDARPDFVCGDYILWASCVLFLVFKNMGMFV